MTKQDAAKQKDELAAVEELERRLNSATTIEDLAYGFRDAIAEVRRLQAEYARMKRVALPRDCQ